MLLKMYQVGQPILRKAAKPLTRDELSSKTVQDVIDFMIATLRDAPGVGLAAPQVGEARQIIIIEDKAKFHEQVPEEVLKGQERKAIRLKVLVNPKLKIVDTKTNLYFEGCLSVEGYVAAVPRVKTVTVEAWDRNGKPITYTAHGWHARILQHEIDHLNGILLIDRMKSKSFMSIKNFNMFWRKAMSDKIQKTF
jgi:peptide deformylase